MSKHTRRTIPLILALVAIVLSLQPYSLPAGLAQSAGTPTVTPSPTGQPAASPTPTVPAPVWNPATVTATAAPTNTPTSPPPATSTATSGPVPVQEPTPPAHHVVLIVIDAARPMYFDKVRLPHIDALMKQGVVYDRAYVGELESSTPGVHVTLGTGTLPRENGFLGFGWATQDTRKWVDFRTLLANGQIDPVLRNLPVPSIAARLHQFYPNAISIAASGHKDYAAVGLGGGAASYVLYGKFATHNQFKPTFLPGHDPPPLTPAERAELTVTYPLAKGEEDAWAFQYASIMARHIPGGPKLLMLNVPEIDTWGHWDGPTNTQTFQTLMKNIDRGIGELEDTYRALGILDRTDFIITGDHAMMESRSALNWKSIQGVINTAGGKVVRADGAGGGIWLQDPTQAKAVAERVVAMKPQHVEAVFYRSGPGKNYQYELASPAHWLIGPAAALAFQHLVDTTAGINGPDLWVLYRENYTVDGNNTSGKWKGTHGGASWKVQHIPLIISGPDIRKGVHSQFPARAIDIAPTIERLLGLPFIPRDGVILADAFTTPLPGEKGPQKAIAASLSADVTALHDQSIADDKLGVWPAHTPIYVCGTKAKPNKACTPNKNTPSAAANE